MRPRSTSARPRSTGASRRAPELEVGARIEAGQVVVDAQGPRGPQAEVEVQAPAFRGLLLGGAQGEELRGHVVAARVHRLLHVDGAGGEAARLVSEQAQVGVDEAAQPLGPAQRTSPHLSAARRRTGGARLRRPGSPRREIRPPARLPFTSSRVAPPSVKRTVPVRSETPWGKPRTRRPAPSRRSVPCEAGLRPRAREGEVEAARAERPHARAHRGKAAQVGLSRDPQVERPVSQEVRLSADREVRAFREELQLVDGEARPSRSAGRRARASGPDTRGPGPGGGRGGRSRGGPSPP